MECYYQYSNSVKEKRPPLRRGQLKRQTARTLSNLMVPGGGDVDQSAGKQIAAEPLFDILYMMRLPVVMQLHPSWLMYHHFCVRLACALPVVVVAVELPLAPERRLPAHIDTSVDVLRQLRSIALSDAGALGDPTEERPLTSPEDTFGGNIVGARVCEDGEDSWVPLRVAGCIPLHPGFVHATWSKSELEPRPDSVFFTLYMLDKFLTMVLPEGATKDHPTRA
uniref:Alpha/beta hydrolase fold-3 domain-containing protein n=1 Tax=Oryza punctata TaxID=4537 RepID=A0A0E0L3K0_ORYPU